MQDNYKDTPTASTTSLSSIFGGKTKFKDLTNTSTNNNTITSQNTIYNNSNKENKNSSMSQVLIHQNNTLSNEFNSHDISSKHSSSHTSLSSSYSNSLVAINSLTNYLHTPLFNKDNNVTNNNNNGGIVFNNIYHHSNKNNHSDNLALHPAEKLQQSLQKIYLVNDINILKPTSLTSSPLKNDYTKDNNSNINKDTNNSNTLTPPSSPNKPNLLDRININNLNNKNGKKFFDKYHITGTRIGEGASGTVTVIENKQFEIEQKSTEEKKHKVSKLYAMKTFNCNNIVPESYNNHLNKILLEFAIGSLLHQENLIETIDLLIDNSNRLCITILEYVKYDFFNLVMSNQMTTEESACYFKQLCHGIKYLHDMGISHRDLKLDNCVVDENGIFKLLDFGSAVIFKSNNSSNKIIKCRGIVGSDPYLSPELLKPEFVFYDPRPVDIWGIAIIYYCMIMRKFPWKAPRKNFNSFRLFCEDPDDEGDVSKGPLRILRVLPTRSRDVIGRMLELNPKKRINIDDVLKDKWVRKIDFCHSDHSGGHEHHLVTEEELEILQSEQNSSSTSNYTTNTTTGSSTTPGTENNNTTVSNTNATNPTTNYTHLYEQTHHETQNDYITTRQLSL